MITVGRVRLSKGHLQRLPPDERALLLLFGHAANQISVLIKLLTFSTNGDPLDYVEQCAQAVQTQVLNRLLIGVVHETNELIKRQFLSAPLGKVYIPLLSDSGRDALQSLKRQFGGSSLLARIRNSFVFHYPTCDEVEAALQITSEEEDWNWYLSEARMNSFYLASETAISQGMCNFEGAANFEDAFRSVLQQVIQASDSMLEFLESFMLAVYEKYLSDAKLEAGATIPRPQSLYDVTIPCFVIDPKIRD